MSDTWKEISRRKQEEQAARIPKEWRLARKPAVNRNNYLDIPRECGILTEKELEITERYDATALVKELAEGRLKSVDVCRAFCKRAAIAHQLTNCLTDFFSTEALARAEELDSHLSTHKKPLGPLHGLPISLKDTFRIPGHDSSIGIASLAFNPSTAPSTLVSLLLSLGAVLYCKTNVPQTLMALDSHNNVFGRTLNPLNTFVTAGGSSGGEGALVGMRGSILGIGTDVGGSIRIPAMCQGLYGFKPSWQRVPYAGQEGGQRPAAARLALPASAGPIATTLRDCELLLKTIADAEPWMVDPDVVFGPWEAQGELPSRRRGSSGKPVIGMVRTDGLIEPLPPVRRVLDDVAAALRARGVEVVEMDIRPLFSKCQSLANALFGVEGGNNMFDLLEKTGEPLSPWLSTRLKRKKPMTLEQAREQHAKKAELETKFLEIWKGRDGKEIDAFVCPVAPHPVPPIDRWNGVSYTSSFVLLDYPAATLPVRAVKPNDLNGELPTSEPLSSWDRVNRELWTKVDRSVYLNTPLCVQVVAPKMQERRLYQAMEVIDQALKAGASEKARL
ncbi:hypothetical protein H2201_008430 [Coniosporium apollinis]|uniref:amidase n=1 Tax=Coniosporium apollinis TaxID=61459 RepID=A0ABQ9NG68_9PEZI|nr:hypothetical protein H2201_008430 [Coniosporium apollinis]